MKKWFALILALLMVAVVCGCTAKELPRDAEPEKVVQEYYDRFYDCELKMKYRDMTDILYTGSVQSYNKITRLKEVIMREKLSEEYGFGHETRKNTYIYSYEDTVYSEDGTAVVTVTIDISQPRRKIYADPNVILYGENTFTLVKDDGRWKIVSHEAAGLHLPPYPEYMVDTKVDYDEEKIIAQWKEEHDG